MELKEHENPAKTATPSKHHHPLSWYVKWIASVILIAAMIFTANNIYPYNLFLHFVGLSGWLWVAVIWNDRSLIVLNSVALAIFANGMVAYVLKMLQQPPPPETSAEFNCTSLYFSIDKLFFIWYTISYDGMERNRGKADTIAGTELLQLSSMCGVEYYDYEISR